MSAGTAADDQFYREYILDHYKNPRNFGRLENPDISHEENNPLCGDVIGMDFRIKDGVIEDIRFHGGFDAAVTDGDELTIVPAIAGG